MQTMENNHLKQTIEHGETRQKMMEQFSIITQGQIQIAENIKNISATMAKLEGHAEGQNEKLNLMNREIGEVKTKLDSFMGQF